MEAATYSGQPVVDLESARDALPRLAQLARTIVITLGGDGVLIQSKDDAPHWIAAQPVQVVSTHGAADCFVGTFAAGLARGAAPLDAAQAAAAALVGRRAAGDNQVSGDPPR